MGPSFRSDVVLSVVVPIYNEQEVLDALHQALTDVLENIGEPWEIVYVSDGCTDSSLEMLLRYQSLDPRITVVELSRNWGHQPALTAGLQVARGEAVVMMDGDFQDPPETITELVEAWRRGAEVVVAQRRSRNESGFRTFLYPLFYKFLGLLSDYPIPLNAGIFGLLDRRAVDAINTLTENNRYIPGLRAWVGFNTAVVYYDRADRAAGRPKQTFLRLLKYGLDAIFSFSYKPLRLSLLLGFTTAFFAILYGSALVIGRTFGIHLMGPVVWGYTSTIVSVLFMGGVQLICIGLLGEYIGRIYDEVKRRPLFLVRNLHRAESGASVMASNRRESTAA
ncbi:MAG: glycosyltransferase family 2 protein [Terriglobales bacterium]